MKNIKRNTMAFFLLTSIACGTEEQEKNNLEDMAIPDARPINLAGSEGLSLQESEDNCSRYGELGVSAFHWGLFATQPLLLVICFMVIIQTRMVTAS